MIVSTPKPPDELWGLWMIDETRDNGGSWLNHTGAPGHPQYALPMTWTSKEDAEAAAEVERGFLGVTIIVALIGVAPRRRR
jgi:hypothetical protein